METAGVVGATGSAPVSVAAPVVGAVDPFRAIGAAGVAGVEGAAEEPAPDAGAAGELGVVGTDGVAPPGADPGAGTAGVAGAAAMFGVAGAAGEVGAAGEPTWAGPETWLGACAEDPGTVGRVATRAPPWMNDRPKIDDGAACARSTGDLTTTGTTGEAQLLGTCAPVPGMATGAAPGAPPGPGDAVRPGRLVTVCTPSGSRDGSDDGRVDWEYSSESMPAPYAEASDSMRCPTAAVVLAVGWVATGVVSAGAVGEPAGDGAGTGATVAAAAATWAGSTAAGSVAVGIAAGVGTAGPTNDPASETGAAGIAGVAVDAGLAPIEADADVGAGTASAAAAGSEPGTTAIGEVAEAADGAAAETTAGVAAGPPSVADGAAPTAGATAWIGAAATATGVWAVSGAVAAVAAGEAGEAGEAALAVERPRRIARGWPVLESADVSASEPARSSDRVVPVGPVDTAADRDDKDDRSGDVTPLEALLQIGAPVEWVAATRATGSGSRTGPTERASATWLVPAFRAAAASRRTAWASAKASPKLTSSGPLGTLIGPGIGATLGPSVTLALRPAITNVLRGPCRAARTCP